MLKGALSPRCYNLQPEGFGINWKSSYSSLALLKRIVIVMKIVKRVRQKRPKT